MLKTLTVIKKEFRAYVIITFGLLINTIGWTAFLIPAEIVGGGISGIAALIFYATNIPIAYTYFGINVFIILLGIKVLGASFGIKTIYSVIVISILFALFQKIITQPIVYEGFMATIIGAGMAGVGIGIVFTQGGSTGGTDIFAMIVNKYRNISPGKIILILDIFIISSSFFLFHSLEKLVYGFVSMAVVSYSIDLILSGSKQSVQIFIFSENFNSIAEKINQDINRGITIIDGQGWYTKKDKKILMIIVRKHEIQKIIKIVKSIDPKGFISMGSVMGVYGKGFEEIRP